MDGIEEKTENENEIRRKDERGREEQDVDKGFKIQDGRDGPFFDPTTASNGWMDGKQTKQGTYSRAEI
ncbi:uncharacterized protein FFB20_07497 [Fusarium fujikuroi]|nr:uncharacterized protein FFE2_03711 [Fusarium fujikuroi]SCN79153.1 uncharacterized protein FFM5_02044 [Fusarium fujikuroi]SCN85782.1 uncharacterized protein FFB20_07497 [Fusarium fujikuroi]SCN95348.1 uncharacterized protein FFC1_07293 [Fusarium fujikuroi]SCO33401.1 uncharacterized protein FFMR_03045 [Fusarium fujikuroi]